MIKILIILILTSISNTSFSYEIERFNSLILRPILDQRIEIVNGQIKKGNFGGVISKELSDFISENELIELQIRNMYINTEDLYHNASEVQIILFYSIRFYETIIKQATLNIESNITISTVDGFIESLDNKNFHYSQNLEKFGHRLGLLDNYRGEFVNLVSQDIVLPYLRKNAKIIRTFIETKTKNPIVY